MFTFPVFDYDVANQMSGFHKKALRSAIENKL